MGRPLGCSVGKLLSLHALPRDQWEAVEADLLDKGFTLSDVPARVTWRALLAMIKYSQRTSAVAREALGAEASWSVTDHLLAGVLDYSALIAWLNSDTKKNKRPKPIQRPGVEEKTDDLAFGAGSTVKVSEFWELWNSEPEQTMEGGDQVAGGSGSGDPEHHPVDAWVASPDRPRDARGRFAARRSAGG